MKGIKRILSSKVTIAIIVTLVIGILIGYFVFKTSSPSLPKLTRAEIEKTYCSCRFRAAEQHDSDWEREGASIGRTNPWSFSGNSLPSKNAYRVKLAYSNRLVECAKQYENALKQNGYEFKKPPCRY